MRDNYLISFNNSRCGRESIHYVSGNKKQAVFVIVVVCLFVCYLFCFVFLINNNSRNDPKTDIGM